jgi:crossover junction endodeoxyribonuclease RusA
MTMAALTVTFPWPHKDLSPNARKHWRAVSKRKKAYRTGCAWEAQQAFNEAGRPIMRGVVAKVTFHPPCARKRDLDNAIASIKAGLDGIADVIGVDDSQWGLSQQWGEPVKFGRVSVEFNAAEVVLPIRGTINANERKA